MAATILSVRDDTKFFELALQEYREAAGDYSTFPELSIEAHQQVLDRAQQLKEFVPRGVSGRIVPSTVNGPQGRCEMLPRGRRHDFTLAGNPPKTRSTCHFGQYPDAEGAAYW